MASAELTLIVAATRNMGIGANGGMPWKGLRKEMAYFARVTSRPSPTRPGALNAVIMGRKTWDSIPPKFRPLKDRLNIIISRSHPPTTTPPSPPSDTGLWMTSLESALEYAAAESSSISRVFVIGGAQIYGAALKLPEAKRVLLTSIKKDFECDTFFPLDLSGEGAEGWERKSTDEWRSWTGEQGTEEKQEEAGTPYEFQLWERKERD